MNEQSADADASGESLPAESTPPPARPQIETLIGRALRLRCPKCGVGQLYRNWTRMHERCSHCNLRIQRDGGYYLGATYINYGLTALSMTSMFLFLRLGLNISTQTIIWPLFSFCVVFPILIFRHARALWLALDCQFDRAVMDDDG